MSEDPQPIGEAVGAPVEATETITETAPPPDAPIAAPELPGMSRWASGTPPEPSKEEPSGVAPTETSPWASPGALGQDRHSLNFYSPLSGSLSTDRSNSSEMSDLSDMPSKLGANEVQALADAVTAEIHKAIVGQDEAIELSIAGLLADGHVLLEGVPGTAKTLLVRALAVAITSDFKRIQFTPDLMPSDITGTRIFDQRVMEFVFRPGPIFTGLLLADEINRTPPKTQAALLEAMQEHRVTVDGESHDLPSVFMVFATSNPIEFEGTYPLPEAQLDRFLLKVLLGYPSAEAEQKVLRRHHQGFNSNDLATAAMAAVADIPAIENCRRIIATVRVEDAMFKYICDLVAATRDHRQLVLGASPRASIALLQVGKTLAAMRGRDFVIPDDIKSVAPAVLRHRLLLRPEAEIEGTSADQIIEDILQKLEVPR